MRTSAPATVGTRNSTFPALCSLRKPPQERESCWAVVLWGLGWRFVPVVSDVGAGQGQLPHRLCWEVIHWGQYIPIYVCIYVDVHRAHILKKRRFWKASSSPGRSRINWCQEGSSACVLTQVLPVWSGAHVYAVVIHMCVFSSLLFPHISLYSFVSSS